MEEKSALSLVDTHTHLASSRFEGEIDTIISRANQARVGRLVAIGCDLEDSHWNVEFARGREGIVPTVGVHPLYVHELDNHWQTSLRALAENPGIGAIGEVGLDYYHPPADGSSDSDWRARQREVFEWQLDLAVHLGLPVVIHQRNSAEDVATVLRNFPGVTAVLHCFTGTREQAETALEMGHFLSFTGILTFPSASEIREVAACVPLDRTMIETDSPYLAPVPHRGKRCEPAHVVEVARQLADVHRLPFDEVARQTTTTAERFFRGLC